MGKSSSALEQITAYWTNDNTVVINTPQVRLVHQGKTVTLEVNNTPNGSQCGLCGDYNMDKRTDVLSSKGCIMSSVKLAAHTYRSKSKQCRPISEKTLSQIRTEEERCVKFETKETKVKSVFNSNCMTADPSRSTLTSTRMTRSASLRFLLFSAPSTPCHEKEDCQLCLSSRGTCCKALC